MYNFKVVVSKKTGRQDFVIYVHFVSAASPEDAEKYVRDNFYNIAGIQFAASECDKDGDVIRRK